MLLIAVSALSFEWQQVTDADWAITEDPDRGIRDAVIVFEKIVVDDEDLLDDKSYYTAYRRIRILSPEGREWGDVVSEHFHKDQKIEEIRGRTIHRDGTTYSLDESQIHEKEVFVAEGVKVKQKAFSLPQVSDDCIVEYYMKYRFDESPHLWVIQKDIYMLEAEYLWKFCRGKGLAGSEYRKFPGEVSPNYVVLGADEILNVERRPSLKKPKEIVFTIEDVPAFDSEPFAPPDIALKWQMRHYYGEPGAAAAFWGDICKDFGEFLTEYTHYNHLAVDVIEDFGQMRYPLQKIRTSYAWLNENIRNTDLDDTDEELEGNGCVSAVIHHEYGNSFDISITFYDMLREMDIDAKLAFTIDRNDNVFIEDAKYWQFERSLVAVPDKAGGYTFYKPGYDYLAPGELHWFSEGTRALVIGDEREQFYEIPFSDAQSNQRSRDLVLKLSEDLRLTGAFTEECEGQPARSHRAQLRKATETEVTQYLKEFLSANFPGFEADSLSVEGADNTRVPLTIHGRVEADFVGQQMGGRLLLNPDDLLSKQENPLTSDQRKCDIMFDYASETNEKVILNLPDGWAVEALPNDTTFSNPVGECRISFSKPDRALSISRRFTIVRPNWEATAYNDVRQLFQMRQAFNQLAVMLNKEETHSQ
jgi:hypothetical protein